MTLPVYVLHCAELPQRTAVARAHITEQIPDACFWKSVHGTTWGLQTVKEFDPGKRISPGHCGLLLGHWTLWNHLWHTLPAPERTGGQDAAAIVLEDDAVLPPNFWGAVNDVRAELLRHNPGWQFVFLGLAEQETPGLWNKLTDRLGAPDSRLCRAAYPWGTHAIMLRRSALPVLIDNMALAERNIDQQLFERVLRPGLVNWCAVIPSIIHQRTYDYSGSGSPEWAPSTITNLDGGDDLFHANQPLQDANRRYVCRPDMGVTYEQAMGKPGLPQPPNDGKQSLVEPPTVQHPDVIAASLRLTEPFPCIYRGESAEPVVANGRVVPTWECALLNRPCHQRAALVLPGNDPVSCEQCTRRLEMGGSGASRDRLPLPDGHFNPSMIVWGDRIILATRDSWGHSRVGLWELTNPESDWSGAWAVKPISSVASGHPLAPRLEDPRLFVAPHPDTGVDALHASFSMPDGYPPKHVRVGYVRFAPDLKSVEHSELFESPNDCAYEKNWVPLILDGITHWVYGTKPWHVVMAAPPGDADVWSSRNDFAWTGGVIRGGCPPVLHDGVCYHFYHGCLKRPHGNIYTVGCYTFEPDPPFRVLRQTPTPIVWPDLPGPGESVVKRYVVFPGGAVPHAGHWHVACGIDDTFVRIVRLSFADVEAALDATATDTGDVTSIRGTQIATGVPDAERPR